MDKKEVLQTRIRKLEEKLGVSYADTKYADKINSSEKLLLYKYVKLLQADDRNKELRMTEKEIRKVFALENIKNQGRELSKEQEEYLSGSTEIFYEHQEKQGEYEKCVEDYEASEAPIKPLTKKDIQTISNHAEELDGIVDVNKELIENFQGDINNFLGIKEGNENDENNFGIADDNEKGFEQIFEKLPHGYDTGALAPVTTLDEKTFDVDEEMAKIRGMQKIKEALLKKFELARNIKNYDMNRDNKEKEMEKLMEEISNNPTLEKVERMKGKLGVDINTLCCGVAAKKTEEQAMKDMEVAINEEAKADAKRRATEAEVEAQNVADSYNKFQDKLYGIVGEVLDDVMSDLAKNHELKPEMAKDLKEEITENVTEYIEKMEAADAKEIKAAALENAAGAEDEAEAGDELDGDD